MLRAVPFCDQVAGPIHTVYVIRNFGGEDL
jgi:hypothetical protein